MLEALKDKFTNRVLEFEMRGVFGNQAGIRAEKKSHVVQMLEFVWPDVQAAVQKEISVVSDAVSLAEQHSVVARENAKLAQEQVTAATKTLEASLQAVAAANIHAESAMQAVRASAAALILAKDEFARLSEKSRG